MPKALPWRKTAGKLIIGCCVSVFKGMNCGRFMHQPLYGKVIVMENKLEKREETALIWVSYDYESLDAIISNVSKDVGKSISMEELHYILSVLRSKGFVNSYIYSNHDEKYVVQAPIGQYPQLELLWYITENGEKYLEDRSTAND
jgi:hypothetical protein